VLVCALQSRPQFLLSESQISKSYAPPSSASSQQKGKNKTVEYLIVILAAVMVALYALLVHWLLPKS
jgi:hypothetical protein